MTEASTRRVREGALREILHERRRRLTPVAKEVVDLGEDQARHKAWRDESVGDLVRS
jgi:hypothetical protein